MRFLLALTLFAAVAAAQALSFEVASIKPAAAPSGARPSGNRVLADRLDYQYASLRTCIAFAYGVQDYQISGPSWLGDDRWQIEAKAPIGSTREQFPEMMRTLLADRFKLQARVEKRDFDGLALVVGKNGPKLERADRDPSGGVSFNRMFRFGGGGRVTSPSLSMQEMARMMSGVLGRPVADETGLDGSYKVLFEYNEFEGRDVIRPVSGPPPQANAEPGGSIFTSVQAMGLRLEQRKVSLDAVIVERADKTPTEN